MCIYISVGLSPQFSRGPFNLGPDGYEPNRCRKSWWTHIFYINNLGPHTEETVRILLETSTSTQAKPQLNI